MFLIGINTFRYLSFPPACGDLYPQRVAYTSVKCSQWRLTECSLFPVFLSAPQIEPPLTATAGSGAEEDLFVLSPPTTASISGGVMAAVLTHLFKYILAYIKSLGSFCVLIFRGS